MNNVKITTYKVLFFQLVSIDSMFIDIHIKDF